MYSILVLAMIFAMGLLALRGYQASRLRRVGMQRIGLQVQEDMALPGVYLPDEPLPQSYPPRYHYVAPLVGLLVAAVIFWGTSLPKPYAVGAGILIGAIAYLFEQRLADKRIERIEAQLADAIDLMVASLRAGSALVASLEATLREAREPLRGELENMIGRIQVGEDPRDVVRDLSVRVPLESFRLFAHSLLVHWETGGSVSSSLRTVGRTVRDRLEVSRRISAQAIESQASVFAVMAITYGLLFIMLSSNPAPVKKLLFSAIGSAVACGLMILEAIGMVWIWRMSRIRF